MYDVVPDADVWLVVGVVGLVGIFGVLVAFLGVVVSGVVSEALGTVEALVGVELGPVADSGSLVEHLLPHLAVLQLLMLHLEPKGEEQ